MVDLFPVITASGGILFKNDTFVVGGCGCCDDVGTCVNDGSWPATLTLTLVDGHFADAKYSGVITLDIVVPDFPNSRYTGILALHGDYFGQFATVELTCHGTYWELILTREGGTGFIVWRYPGNPGAGPVLGSYAFYSSLPEPDLSDVTAAVSA